MVRKNRSGQEYFESSNRPELPYFLEPVWLYGSGAWLRLAPFSSPKIDGGEAPPSCPSLLKTSYLLGHAETFKCKMLKRSSWFFNVWPSANFVMLSIVVAAMFSNPSRVKKA